MTNYISLFTGIGGLESEHRAPSLCCEIDTRCHDVLRRRFGPSVELHPDVTTLEPPHAEVVAGGWPCQDISVAGLQRGLKGKRSGLFFELLRVARDARAHTLIAENVPNLLNLENGLTFRTTLEALAAERTSDGRQAFPYIAWRTLNARAFNLPHHRERVFIIASQHREIALALHRGLPTFEKAKSSRPAAGFYWTAGLQSICYSTGFVPTLKVGSALSIPSPPALHFDGVVRKATTTECLEFQGFTPAEFEGVAAKDVYRMTGNAVAAPVGRWVFRSLDGEAPANIWFKEMQTDLFGNPVPTGRLGDHGFLEEGTPRTILHEASPMASNLWERVDRDNRTMLSSRAAAGLLLRLKRSGKECPPALEQLLRDCAGTLDNSAAELESDPDFNPADLGGDNAGAQAHMFAS